MPVRKNESGKRWVELEYLMPGTPEQIWHAMATGPGNAAWFVRGEIEPRVGGSFRLDFGHGVATNGEVTAWEPHHRFAYVEHDWEPGAPPVATEITIVGRSGGMSVVRMVHSLFTSSDQWDDQVEGFEKGWPAFFDVLRVYLRHFAGEAASGFMTVMPSSLDSRTAWAKLAETLGYAGANVGDVVKSSAPEQWSAVVEHLRQDSEVRYIVMRIDDPSPGTVLISTLDNTGKTGAVEAAVGKARGSTNVSVCRYFYGATAIPRQADERWRDWLVKLLS